MTELYNIFVAKFNIKDMRKETIKILEERVNKDSEGKNQSLFEVEFIRKPLKVRIKKLIPEAIVPKYAKPGDAGMDLVATSCSFDQENNNYVYGTGLAMEIPYGYVGLIFPRSSNRKTNCYMTNHVGVIDSGYRGEVMITYKDRNDHPELGKEPYKIGDRIAQIIIMPYPLIEFEEAEELSETERGTGGHGSTGN